MTIERFYDFSKICKTADCLNLASEIGLNIQNGRCQAVWRNGTGFNVALNRNGWYDHKTKEKGSIVDLVSKVLFNGDKQQAQQWLGDHFNLTPEKQKLASSTTKELRIVRLLKEGYKITAYYSYYDILKMSQADCGGKQVPIPILVFQVIRLEHKTQPKEFIQRTKRYDVELPKNESIHDWFYSLKNILKRKRKLPLYQLPQWYDKDNIIFLEGEKDVHTAINKLGLYATCNAGGAGNIRNFDFHHLHGKKVTIIPDNDLSGLKAALKLFNVLNNICNCKIVFLPFDTPKGDLTDFYDESIVQGLNHDEIKNKIFAKENYLSLDQLHEKIRKLEPEDKRSKTSSENGRKGGRDKAEYFEVATGFIVKNKIQDIFCFRKYRSTWYQYNSNVWQEISNDDLKHLVMSYLQLNYDDCCNKNFRDNIIANLESSQIGGLHSTYTIPCWLDGKPANGWMAFQNYLVNIEMLVKSLNGEPIQEKDYIKNHTPKLFNTFKLPYNYNTEAQCPKFMKYIADVQPNEQDREIIQMLYGLALVPDTSYEVIIVIFGEGGTGKTVCLEVLRNLVGVDNCCTLPLNKFTEKHSTHLLTENLLNICGDLPTSDGKTSLHQIEGLLKDVASGGLLPIEKKCKDVYSGPAIARNVFATNSLPVFADRSDGIWDRLRIIMFNQKFRGTGQQNPMLKQEIISEELSGVFNWAIKGLAKLRKLNQFPHTQEGLKISQEHRAGCDHEFEFLSENYEIKNGCYIPSARLYQEYSEFCQMSGYKRKNAGNFKKEVMRIFNNVHEERSCVTEGNIRILRNLKKVL